MSESRFTITLGRNGQKVVRRARPISDSVRSDSMALSGRKRSIKDRLGSSVGSSIPSVKRNRGDDIKSSSIMKRLDDVRVGRNDLRLKLMRRRQSREEKSESEHYRKMEQQKRSMATDHRPSRHSVSLGMSELRDSSYYREIPHTEKADEFLLRRPPRGSNSFWTVNGSRHNPPGKVLGSSRGFSPPNYIESMRPLPSMRSIEVSKNGGYRGSNFVSTSRQVGPISMSIKDPLEQFKPIAPPTASGSVVQKSSYVVQRPSTTADVNLSVPEFLNSLGLGKYVILLQAEEVDMTALKQMGDTDLKELGIPMGPRKKILLALLPSRNKRQPPS